jgi:hypothetical protein
LKSLNIYDVGGRFDLCGVVGLEELICSFCESVNDEDLIPLVHLKCLKCRAVRAITGICLKSIIHLTELDISETGVESDEVLNGPFAKNLVKLNISSLSELSGGFLCQMKKLKVLKMKGCSSVIERFLEELDSLTTIDFSGCPRITGSFLLKIGDHVINLKRG